MEKQVVFVLGVGRSGTSALARVLSLCGGALPERLWPAHESNPTGHWEPVEAIEINNAFLHARDSTWFDPSFRLQGETEVEPPERQAFLDRVGEFLLSWQGSFLVVKEPRITALADLWFEAARRHGFAVKAVIAVRHPAEVIGSLVQRDGMSQDLAAMLWLKYALLAERQSRPIPRVFVGYSDLIGDWRGQFARIQKALSLPALRMDVESPDAFLRADLQHHKHGGADPWNAGILPLADVYQALRNATADAPLNILALDRAFDLFAAQERAVRRSWTEFRGRFGPVAEAKHYEAAELVETHHATAAEDERADIDALNAKLTASHARIEDLQQEADRLRQQIVAVHGSASWRLTAPMRAITSRARLLMKTR